MYKSRRDFIRASSLLVAGGAVPGGLQLGRSVHAWGGDLIRVGLIGCGAVGKEAATGVLSASGGPVQLVALADVFGDRVQSAYRQLRGRFADQVDVPQARRFAGLQAYRQLLEAELDLVLLATAPAFRPLHFESAVAAGKHVYLALPVAVDPQGVERVMAAGYQAQQKGLAVRAGLPHRHDAAYRETVQQVKDGRIGEIVAMRVYHNGHPLRWRPRRPGESELEHQLRNWAHYSWLAGDTIVDRHVGNLDVGNWLAGRFPIVADAWGQRSGEDGQPPCWNQFFCEYGYPGGVRMFSQCRQQRGCWNNVSEHVQGTRGRADIRGGKLYDLSGQRIWHTTAVRAGQLQQQVDLIGALRAGRVPNEAALAAKSTMTAILARLSAYRRAPVHWRDAFQPAHTFPSVDHLESLEERPPSESMA